MREKESYQVLFKNYAVEVGRHLPRRKREDIQMEIMSLLEDALEDTCAQERRQPDEDAALEVLVRQGCLNDEATAFRWAQARVQQRLWGRAKIDVYLARKGIDRDIIAQVQKAVWQTCSEEDIARQALAKRFPSFHDHRSAYAKAAAFLKSRGFSSEVIYKLVSELDA